MNKLTGKEQAFLRKATLDPLDLEGLAADKVEVESWCHSGEGEVSVTLYGVSVWDVLERIDAETLVEYVGLGRGKD